ncbi:hypothetical protein [Ancylobacter pratisalsi]|uniref:Uncharacterized protein n=1 Tax=Ancylobacter pratisalsi TaxID=1745854 RepID=A0A6P1YH57_9HYPH|nr:hypothetical protein [Ancylobacter pratisalsi]QIB32628.1 hypothetical protein G3A50_02100 [Ancylobacter pratisalsi]
MVFTLPNIDLTGSDIDLSLSWQGGSLRLTSESGRLVVAADGAGNSTITWQHTISESQMFRAPLVYDLWRTIDGRTSKLDAGLFAIARSGAIIGSSSASILVPGVQGPAAFVPRGAWQAGTYQPRDAVTHNGSTWWTQVETTTEPGAAGADWEILLDGTGAAADRQAAADAAALAVPAATTAGNAAELATTARDDAIAARDQAIAATRYTRIAADGHALVAGSRILADLSAGPLTWSMPAAPSAGDIVGLMVDGDAAASPLTLEAGDESFLGGSTLIVDLAGARLDLVYVDGLWRF